MNRPGHKLIPLLLLTLTLGCGGDSGPTDQNDPPSSLAFVSQPGPQEPGQLITPALEVAVQDESGTTVTDVYVEVTLSLAAGPDEATLSGTLTEPAVNGIATFSDLRIDVPAGGYVLRASTGVLTEATTDPFNVLVDFVQVSAGAEHTCAVSERDHAYCWGRNADGRLGDNSIESSSVPVPVVGDLEFIALGLGDFHTCGVTPDGEAYCWGNNNGTTGSLGNGSTTDSSSPVAVSGGYEFVRISVGRAHTCALTAEGAAYCWGRNLFGQLGDNSLTDRTTPVAVSGSHDFAEITTGLFHTCGVTTSDVAYCWGFNGQGQLGDGSTSDRMTPVEVSGTHSFATLSAGGFHSCGIRTDGATYCWGHNETGQLGDDSSTDRAAPVPVSGGHDFASVSAGGDGSESHTCGVTTEGSALCWGSNHVGQLGNNTTTDRATPWPVAGSLEFASIDAGASHTCGMTTGGFAYCWGHNGSGRLGDNSTDQSWVPVPVVQ